MSDSKLTIWCNARFDSDAGSLLRDGIGEHKLVISDKATSSNLVATEPDPQMGEADIIFGQPDPRAVLASQRIGWIHLTSAGYTRYDTEAFRAAGAKRELILTNSSTVYAEPCAQHAAAFIYALARQLPQAMHNQQTDRAWPARQLRQNSVLLGGQRTLMFGFGSIAARLMELLAPLWLDIVGVRRTPMKGEPLNMVTPPESDALLPEADLIINLLPANPSTENYFNAERIARFKRGVVFINIGRGSTVDQDALLAALEEGRIGAALLDVTTPEPLPPDHPLWRHPNCTITPHTAGGFRGEHQALVQHFLDNFERFTHQREMLDRVI